MDDFLDRSRLVAKTSAVLVRTHPAQRSLDAALAIILQIRIELRHELVGTDARPVPEIEELVLQPSEEALARGVVGAAPLGRHAPGQGVLLAYAYPLGPSVMPAAVGVDRGRRAGPSSRDGLLQARVGQPLGRTGACSSSPGRAAASARPSCSEGRPPDPCPDPRRRQRNRPERSLTKTEKFS